MQKELSIIYVNYNTADQVMKSVESVRRHTKGIDYETPETMDPPVDYSSYYQQLGLDPSQVMINE